MLLLYGLFALYALEIVLPLLALAIAFVIRSTRRVFANQAAGDLFGQDLAGAVLKRSSGNLLIDPFDD